MTLWLASKSAARRSMLEAAGVEFRPVDSLYEEAEAKAAMTSSGALPPAMAAALAAGKAAGAEVPEGDLVIGADQVLELDDGRVLDKPSSRAVAQEQLRRLRGRTHKLHSAACIMVDGQTVFEAIETASLAMRNFSEEFLSAYLAAEYAQVRWNVGAYRIEGPGIQLFDRIEGSHFAILGLPLLPLLAFLRDRGVLPA